MKGRGARGEGPRRVYPENWFSVLESGRAGDSGEQDETQCSPALRVLDWPQTSALFLPLLASLELGLQACAATPRAAR